jgi:hypothetical protein
VLSVDRRQLRDDAVERGVMRLCVVVLGVADDGLYLRLAFRHRGVVGLPALVVLLLALELEQAIEFIDVEARIAADAKDRFADR